MIELLRFGFADARFAVEVGGTECFESAARDFGIGIARRSDDAGDACLNQSLRTGAGASRVVAGFERDVSSGAAGLFAGGFERNDFGVVAPAKLMETFADDVARVDDDTADSRIRAGEADAVAREFQRTLHEADVVIVHSLVEKGGSVGFGIERDHVIELFAGAHKTDRQAEFAGDSDDDSALGGAVEFG